MGSSGPAMQQSTCFTLLASCVVFVNSSPITLRQGDAHVVDGFLSAEDLANFSRILESGALQKDTKYGTTFNEVKTSSEESPYLWSVIQRIQRYAETHLVSDSGLPGAWAYRGRYHPDFFDLRRYGAMEPMKPHMDTGSYARCLSATLHVGSQEHDGGKLQTYKCREKCKLWHGWMTKRNAPQPAEDIRETEDLVLHSEVDYRPGRLVLFLAETPHGVTKVPAGSERDVLFVWHSCEPTLVNGAAATGHINMVDSLVQARASITAADSRKTVPVSQAATSGHIEMMEYLLGKRADLRSVDDQGMWPLHKAALHGHTPMVRLLLQQRASTTESTPQGDSPIDIAALAARTHIVEEFLAAGAVGTTPSPRDTKVLQYAIRTGNHQLAKLLLTRRAPADVEDNQKKRPLFWAAWTGYSSIAKALLDARADPQATSLHNGRPAEAIIGAAEGGHRELTHLLLEAGTSSRGIASAAIVAQKAGHRRIAETLRDAARARTRQTEL